jgi:uncharacterized membrane protein
VWIVIPYFAQGVSYDIRARGGFDYLGDGVGGIILGILKNPLLVLREVFAPGKLIFILILFFSFSFLPLLRSSLLIPAIPSLFIILVSQSEVHSAIFTRYCSPLAPFFFIATIAGLSRCKEYFSEKRGHWKRLTYSLLTLLFCCSILVHLLYPEFKARDYSHAEASRKILEFIPETGSVTASPNFLPHLSQRKELYELIHKVKTEFVIIETNPNHWVTHWMAKQEGYRKAIEEIMADPSLFKIQEIDGILLYRRQ